MSTKLRLNPSAAHTWTECTAQPPYVAQLSDVIPKDQSSEHSREGEVAHLVVEKRFENDPDVAKTAGFKPEMRKHADDFVRFCHGLRGQVPPTDTNWWSERKVPLFYSPGDNGKIDFSGFKADDSLVICDYKYGQGVAVTAVENLQMAIYAVSLVQAERGVYNPFNEVTMAIYQPRVRQGEPITTWTMTYGELLQFVEERVSIPAADIRAKALTLKFAPSTKVCQFCPAAPFCGLEGYEPNFPYSGKLRTSDMLDDTPLAPLRKGLPARLQKPADLDHDIIARITLQAASIKKWLGEVEEYAEARMTDGVEIKGLKLVQGKGGHRGWKNEDDAKEYLLKHVKREEVITEKLVTPAQADKFEHDFPKDEWKDLQQLVFKPEGGPVVVSDKDPRPVYSVSKAAEYFDDETVEDWV